MKMIVALLVHNPSPLILKKTRLEKGKVVSINDGMKQIMDEIAGTKWQSRFNVRKINELNVNVSKLQTSIEELNKYSNNIHEEIKVTNKTNRW